MGFWIQRWMWLGIGVFDVTRGLTAKTCVQSGVNNTSLADSMIPMHCLAALLQMIMEGVANSRSGGSLSANIRWMCSCIS